MNNRLVEDFIGNAVNKQNRGEKFDKLLVIRQFSAHEIGLTTSSASQHFILTVH